MLCGSHGLGSDPGPKREMIEWPSGTGVGQTQTPSNKLHMIRAHDAAELPPPGGTDWYQPVVIFSYDASIRPKPEWKLVNRPAACVRRIIHIVAIRDVQSFTRFGGQLAQDPDARYGECRPESVHAIPGTIAPEANPGGAWKR